MSAKAQKDRHKDKLLPIRGPEDVHRRLMRAAELLTDRNRREGTPGKVTASELGLVAVIQYLDKLEGEGIRTKDDQTNER